MWTAKLAIGYENDSVDGKRLMPFWGKNAVFEYIRISLVLDSELQAKMEDKDWG